MVKPVKEGMVSFVFPAAGNAFAARIVDIKAPYVRIRIEGKYYLMHKIIHLGIC